jgi:hypothetical protein
VTHAAPHLSVEEVKERARTDQRYWCRQRWLIIYNALVDPRPAALIAKHVGVSVDTVHQVISRYNRFGVAAVETAGKGGRRHEYVTLEQEGQMLAPFFARAERGEIATAGEIKRAFEAEVGARQSMKARFTACSSDMNGASLCHVRCIPKPAKRNKNSLKKLCVVGGSGAGNPLTRRQPSRPEDGSR